MTERLPSSISPSPIAEAIFEIRFSSNIPNDAIFGILYNEFKNEFPIVENLPILQIPEALRSQDLNLKYAPHYRLPIDKYILQIGPSVFSLSNVDNYVGWSVFSHMITDCYNKLLNSGVVDMKERVALRYINLFQEINIFKNITLCVSLPGITLSENPIHFIVDIPIDNGGHKCIVANHVQAVINGKEIIGSVIDVDTHVLPDASETFEASLEYLHTEEKKLFYKILSEDYLKNLNPRYDDDGQHL